MAQYVVSQTKQIAIDAETPEEAVKKVIDGEGSTISINYSGSPRPQQPAKPTGLPNVPTNMRTGLPIPVSNK